MRDEPRRADLDDLAEPFGRVPRHQPHDVIEPHAGAARRDAADQISSAICEFVVNLLRDTIRHRRVGRQYNFV
jgi:hypothetical protein